MTTSTAGVPDLLQRFVATPYSATVRVEGVEIAIESNVDFASFERERTGKMPAKRLRAVIVQDPEAPADGSEITLIEAWPVMTFMVGSGTVLALDCERDEILGFLAPNVSAARFVNEFVPILIELYERSGRASRYGT